MKIVVIISPYSGNVEAHTAYARACLFDCLTRGEAPLAGHLLYPQVLDDNDPAHREMGMRAGQEMMRLADKAVVYLDHGKSAGMIEDEKMARAARCDIEERWLARWNPVG